MPLTFLFGFWRILWFRPDCIFTIYFNERWILTSYLLSRIMGVPVVYYVHDPYEERARAQGWFFRSLARWLEPKSLRHGHVLVLYDSLRRLYEKKYGLETLVIRHFASEERGNRKRATGITAKPRLRIGFAGTIYENNRNLIMSLIEVCKRDGHLDITLWTNASSETIAWLGGDDSHVTFAFEKNYGRLLEELSNCDLLYLPLAFNRDDGLPTETLRYVLPTKAVDYLLAGPPILAHCPTDFETSRFFSATKAGYCLNADDPGSLSDWLGTWRAGKLEPIDGRAVDQAVSQFSRSENLAALGDYLNRLCDRDEYRKPISRMRLTGPVD